MSVIFVKSHKQALYVECYYAKCRYGECRGTLFLQTCPMVNFMAVTYKCSYQARACPVQVGCG